MSDALVAGALKIRQRQVRPPVTGEELPRPFRGVPVGYCVGQDAGELVEADAIGTLVGAGVRGEGKFASRYRVGHDLRDLPDPVVVRGA